MEIFVFAWTKSILLSYPQILICDDYRSLTAISRVFYFQLHLLVYILYIEIEWKFPSKTILLVTNLRFLF